MLSCINDMISFKKANDIYLSKYKKSKLTSKLKIFKIKYENVLLLKRLNFYLNIFK